MGTSAAKCSKLMSPVNPQYRETFHTSHTSFVSQASAIHSNCNKVQSGSISFLVEFLHLHYKRYKPYRCSMTYFILNICLHNMWGNLVMDARIVPTGKDGGKGQMKNGHQSYRVLRFFKNWRHKVYSGNPIQCSIMHRLPSLTVNFNNTKSIPSMLNFLH
jgi:hypothetical protein